eukprot:GHVU01068955.1.p2 GENE.GHVU01068955.1~~GHVU01068955.1.p2  ORF type:complete len:125 (+),score=6.29 GHVU01068955.1:165-539(+)
MSHSSRQVSTRSVCTVAEKSGRLRNRRDSAPNAVTRFSQPDRHKESTSRGSALRGNTDVRGVKINVKTIVKMHLLWDKITSTDNQYGMLSSQAALEIIGNHMCRSNPAYAHLKSKAQIDQIGRQ